MFIIDFLLSCIMTCIMGAIGFMCLIGVLILFGIFIYAIQLLTKGDKNHEHLTNNR